MNMKLGIAVVYMASPQQRRLLEIHFDFIARHTTVPYTIYGGINRLHRDLRDLVKSQPNFQKAWLPQNAYSAGQQHAADLDDLLARAVADGSTHLAVLHADSWPVRDDWAQWIDARLSEQCVMAGVLRSENGDRLLPSTCGILFRRDFYEQYQPRLLLRSEQLDSSEIRRFQRAFPQTTDSGLSYGHLIWSRKLDWLPLTRSNRHDDHYLLCGVYGDLFFHLGAAARDKYLQGDFAGAGATLARKRVKSLKHWVKHRVPPIVARLYSRLHPRPHEWSQQLEQNQATFEVLQERLYADPEGYIARLRFGMAPQKAHGLPQPLSDPLSFPERSIAASHARSPAST